MSENVFRQIRFGRLEMWFNWSPDCRDIGIGMFSNTLHGGRTGWSYKVVWVPGLALVLQKNGQNLYWLVKPKGIV